MVSALFQLAFLSLLYVATAVPIVAPPLETSKTTPTASIAIKSSVSLLPAPSGYQRYPVNVVTLPRIKIGSSYQRVRLVAPQKYNIHPHALVSKFNYLGMYANYTGAPLFAINTATKSGATLSPTSSSTSTSASSANGTAIAVSTSSGSSSAAATSNSNSTLSSSTNSGTAPSSSMLSGTYSQTTTSSLGATTTPAPTTSYHAATSTTYTAAASNTIIGKRRL